jgi:two-component system, NtrC family, sensor kinase
VGDLLRTRFNSLTFRLTGTLIITLALLLALTTAVQVTLQERYASQAAGINGLLYSETLFAALHGGMLANDRAGLDTAVASITQRAPGVRVRMFNKDGLIVFSSSQSEVGTRVDPRSEACFKCHAADKPIEKLPPGDRTRRFTLAGVMAMGVIRPIDNEPVCATASCHAHPPEKRLLGVLDVTISLSRMEETKRQTTLLMVGTTGLALALVVGVVLTVIRRTVNRPIRTLSRTLDALGAGDFSARYENHEIAEFRRLGDSLNHTAHELERAHSELLEWAQTLERRVDEKTAELKRAQEQMVRVERMASLGKLAAVVAHEINNPLASVVTYAKLLLRRCAQQPTSTEHCTENRQMLDAIASESHRCGEIVSNLLLFARRTGSRFEPNNVNELVRKVLFLIKHKMDLAQVTPDLRLDENLPELLCDGAQIEQALLALAINAIDAMPEGGALTISSGRVGDEHIRLCVADTGIGMDEDLRLHIFEPFFTTKTDGENKGLGLGLAVVYGIIERHSGSIDVDSAPGRGTVFTITLPGVHSPEEEAT